MRTLNTEMHKTITLYNIDKRYKNINTGYRPHDKNIHIQTNIIYTQKTWRSYERWATGTRLAPESWNSREAGPPPQVPMSRLLDLGYGNSRAQK